MHHLHRVDRQIAGYIVCDALVEKNSTLSAITMYTALLCCVVLVVVLVVGGFSGKLPGTRGKSLPPGENHYRY